MCDNDFICTLCSSQQIPDTLHPQGRLNCKGILLILSEGLRMSKNTVLVVSSKSELQYQCVCVCVCVYIIVILFSVGK